jgi:hypothetical protein
MIISNKKFTDIYDKIIRDIESLKSFYFNRYILDLEFETLNFILGELIVSIPTLYNIVNAIKKENDDRKILIKSVNNIRIIVNKLVLLIVISFSNDDKEVNDEFTCNNKEYNLNFFTSNKKNYSAIKIINDSFKIVTQNIEDIKKNNKIIIDNIQVNILFNKIKNNLDIVNDLYLQPIGQALQPVSQAINPVNQLINQPINQAINQPINQALQPIGQAINQQPINQPINPAIQPIGQAINQPINQALQPIGQAINQPINQALQPIGQAIKQPINQSINQPIGQIIKSREVVGTITFKEFCSLNNKNKIKVIIKMIINIIKNIDYKEVNIYNIALFGFIFFLCFY